MRPPSSPNILPTCAVSGSDLISNNYFFHKQVQLKAFPLEHSSRQEENYFGVNRRWMANRWGPLCTRPDKVAIHAALWKHKRGKNGHCLTFVQLWQLYSALNYSLCWQLCELLPFTGCKFKCLRCKYLAFIYCLALQSSLFFIAHFLINIISSLWDE